MKICVNCGAEIENDTARCPYCGYINEEGARKKFQADLDDIRDDIEEVRKEPKKALLKGLSGGTKIVLITLGVLILLAVLFVLELIRETGDKPKLFLSADDQAYASAYIEVAGEQLSEAYENEDIALMAQIFDKAYSEDRVSLWGVSHYETGFASSCYMKLKQCLPELDKGKIEKKKAEEITYYCFYFYYRAYGDDGAAIFDPIREDEIIPIITDRLGFTEEDMEGFRDRVFFPPNVDRSKVYRATKKYYGNYK
ncbi:MAG: zinc ribbon domain-containing protein [Lachnospiraceae bacterium]|nr:zinc ribbon domain-containing protein [Lachnospiraceae bacterium]